MTIQEFRNLHQAAPFHPFTLHLADGRKIPVQHVEFAIIAPSGRTVLVYQPDDSYDVIDLMLVTSLRVNGKRAGVRKH